MAAGPRRPRVEPSLIGGRPHVLFDPSAGTLGGARGTRYDHTPDRRTRVRSLANQREHGHGHPVRGPRGQEPTGCLRSNPRLDTDAISYVRLYAGPDGESHFEDVTVGFTLRTVPPVPPLGVSDWQPAERIFFYNFAPGWYGEPHVAPRRQFVIVLKGATALQASDGEIRHQQVGDVLLAEDTTGKGHATWNEGDDTTLTAVIALPDE